MAIAWMYREDYARAGYLILPKPKTRPLSGLDDRRATLHSLPLVWVQLLPATETCFNAPQQSLLGSGLFFTQSGRFLSASRLAARQLLKATIIYLRCSL